MSSPDMVLTNMQDRLRELSAEHLPPDAAARVEALARPAVRLRHTEKPSRSHLGGAASLPHDVAWPAWNGKSLSLIAVIALADLAEHATDVPLPARGLLNFFYEADEQRAWGFEPSHKDGWRVVLAQRDDAVSTLAPDDALVFPSIGLVPEQTLTVPGWQEPVVESFIPPFLPQPKPRGARLQTRRALLEEERQRDAYVDLLEAWDAVIALGESPDHQIGGWPRLVQASIWKECDITSRGYGLEESPQSNDTDVAALPDTQREWHLLLQLDTDEEAGWMWGDLGTLYYAVRDSVPRPDAFRDAWMVFQCG